MFVFSLQFWLQDTRSSNGTFVNNSRLSSAQPEQDSPPREIFSGDIIQFGVEVVEKSKKGERGRCFDPIKVFCCQISRTVSSCYAATIGGPNFWSAVLYDE